MFYVVDVGVSNTPDGVADKGICFLGSCNSYFNATQKVYQDLYTCDLQGYFYGGLYFFDVLPIEVPLGRVEDEEIIELLQNDEPYIVEAVKDEEMRWIQLKVNDKEVPYRQQQCLSRRRNWENTQHWSRGYGHQRCKRAL